MADGLAQTDYDDLVESAMSLMYTLTLENVTLLQSGKLEAFVEDETRDLLLVSLDDEDHVENAITDAERYLAEYLLVPRQSSCPARAQPTTTVEHIGMLRDQPQPEQGTPAWYTFRHDHLTASNIWKCLGSEANINSLIREKCEVADPKRYSSVSLDSTLHWGHKYEPVSIAIYEALYGTTVSEFGCIPSPVRDYLAASPDGINTDPESDRFGRMVEVKNIVNREITGIPKPEYWVQMQMQMAVCELEFVDFIETRFTEITQAEFCQQDPGTTKQFGYMALFMTESGSPVYEYGDIQENVEKYDSWNAKVMSQHADKQWLKNVFWELDEISIVEVRFNRQWFVAALPFFDRCWSQIKVRRETETHISSPRKRRKTDHPSVQETHELKCLIDIT